MKSIVEELLAQPNKLPWFVPSNQVGDLDAFEERCHLADRYFVNIWSITDTGFEFCPDHDPPDVQTEVLPWLWVLYPELKDELMALGNDTLREMILQYEAPS